MPGSPHPHARRMRQGSPYPDARRRRQGSPHPNAIPQGASASDSGLSPPTDHSSTGPFPNSGPQVVQENIPDYVSMTPAIFVPALFDYTQPRPTPLPANAGDTKRVDRALADLEEHMDAVKRNIASIVLQQARKVQQDAAVQELTLTAQGEPPLRSKQLPPTQADDDTLLCDLEAPLDPARTYGVGHAFGPSDMRPVVPNPKDTPREATVTRLVEWMRFGSVQMEGYESHCVVARKQTRERVSRGVAEEMVLNLARQGRGAYNTATTTNDDRNGMPMDLD